MRAVIFDTETSGLIQNRTMKLDLQAEVIEFFGIDVDLASGKIYNELDLLIKPKKPISAEITKITTLTNEMVAASPTFGEVVPLIIQFIESSTICIAHNLSFDKEILDIECERIGQKINWPKDLRCTVEATVFFKSNRLTLSALYEYLFNEQFVGAHRAKVDVQALTRCAIELYKRECL